jgi:hypothetical protein
MSELSYWWMSRLMYVAAALMFAVAFFVAFGWGGLFILSGVALIALGLKFDDMHFEQVRNKTPDYTKNAQG